MASYQPIKYVQGTKQCEAIDFIEFQSAVLNAQGTYLSAATGEPRRFLPFDFKGRGVLAVLKFFENHYGVAYTADDSTQDAPHFHALLALSRGTDPDEGVALGIAVQALIEAELDEGMVTFDQSAYRAEQPLPTPFKPLNDALIPRFNGTALDVDEVLHGRQVITARDLVDVDKAALAARMASVDRDLQRLMDGKPVLWAEQTPRGRDLALATKLHQLHCTPDQIGLCVSNYQHGEVARHDDIQYLNEIVREACASNKSGLPDTSQTLCESLTSFMAERKPQEVLLEGILYKGDHNAAMGHPNAGKTSGILDMALHIALGIDFGKRKVMRSRVLYLAGEDPAGIRRRVMLWCQTHKKDIKDFDGWFFVIKRPVLDDAREVARLRIELKIVKPELMVTDTFSANYGGESEDKATDVKKWLKMMREEFIGEFNCCAITMHHPPKGAVDIHNWRGSGAAAGDLDNVFCFRNLGDSHFRMDQAEKKAKHRTAEFEPLTWQTEKASIIGWFDNMGMPETTVRATLVSDYKVESSARVCLAIKVLSENGGKPSHAAIAELAGVAPGSVDSLLKKLKTKGGLPNFPGKTLVTQKDDGAYHLTTTGKVQAGFAAVDTDMAERIAELKGGDDDEADDDDAE